MPKKLIIFVVFIVFYRLMSEISESGQKRTIIHTIKFGVLLTGLNQKLGGTNFHYQHKCINFVMKNLSAGNHLKI